MAVTIYPVNRGTTAGDGTGDTAYVGSGKLNDSLTNLKAAVDLVLDVNQNYLLGRTSTGTGNPEKLAPATVRTLLNVEDGATADQTAGEIEAIVNHDNLLGFEANEHLNWTVDLGATNIHANNLPLFSSSAPGAVSASGGGTTNYLRADGSWAAPSASVPDPLTSVTTIYNTALWVGYSTTTGLDFGSTVLNVDFSGSTEFQFQSDGDFHADGNIYAYSTTTGSDRKLKKDFDELIDALQRIRELTGLSYTLKKTGERKAGLIAQDVQLVLPEAVSWQEPIKENEEGHLALDYNGVLALVVNAIKELADRVDALESAQ